MICGYSASLSAWGLAEFIWPAHLFNFFKLRHVAAVPEHCLLFYSHPLKYLFALEIVACIRVCAQLLGCIDSLQPRRLQPAWLFCAWNFPVKDVGVDCHFLLQGIFLTQRSNPCLLGLLHWQVDSLPPCCLGSPEIIQRQVSAKHPLLPVSVLGSKYAAMKSASLAFMELTFWFVVCNRESRDPGH